jgi:hypothetical protein
VLEKETVCGVNLVQYRSGWCCVRKQERDLHIMVICQEGRFRYEVLNVTIKAGFVELCVGLLKMGNTIVVANDPIVQHFLRGNAKCKKHQQCSGKKTP